MSARPAFLRRLFAGAAVALAFAASGGPARADTVQIADSELPGLFTGSVTYTFTSTTSAVLTVQLTNVSPTTNGGYITAFAFNDPAGAGGTDFKSVTLTSAPSPFKLVGSASKFSTNSLDGSPYGNFDLGVSNSTKPSQPILGGGNPTTGLAVNTTSTFVFNISGSGLNQFSAAELLSTFGTDGTSAFLVRFRGFNDGSSDKDVVGVPMNPPPPPPGNAVPAPPGLVLAGMGFGCLLLRRLRTGRAVAPRA
jgi:hypothetical protein